MGNVFSLLMLGIPIKFNSWTIAPIILSVALSCFLVLPDPEGVLDCTQYDGYNASGTSDADKFPAETYAGLCYDNNHNVRIIYFTFLMISLVVLWDLSSYVVEKYRERKSKTQL